MNQKHGVKCFLVHDNIFNGAKNYISDFHDAIRKRNLLGQIEMWATLRVHDLNKDILQCLTELKCGFSIGIESFSQPVLDMMGKGSNLIFLLDLLKNLEVYKGGPIYMHNIFGFPGETLKMFQDSLKVFMKTKIHIMENTMNFFVLSRDSNIHKSPDKYNIEIVPFPEITKNYFPELNSVLDEFPMTYIDLLDSEGIIMEKKKATKRFVDRWWSKRVIKQYMIVY